MAVISYLFPTSALRADVRPLWPDALGLWRLRMGVPPQPVGSVTLSHRRVISSSTTRDLPDRESPPCSAPCRAVSQGEISPWLTADVTVTVRRKDPPLAGSQGSPQSGKEGPMPADGRPVGFIHGLWLNATSWTPWLDPLNVAG